ncbi:sensor histidine kinase [Streptomonospora litoralis]|uniref:Sensor histidine kinase DesK n=1 Tax=Streptomonospora litoralis TaxID=2498135 RepID=A0A4P6Q4V2_9ACTN|nr:histidine kinase [Streptomonospora litoralis]QBI53999.1 Sensor histidine kinase DesK [Streptomonospora litoralis]
MRKLGPAEWSGLAMLVVSVVVAGPVLAGLIDPVIARGWWTVLFALFIAMLLVAVADQPPAGVRYAAFAVSVAASWAALLTASNLGVLPVLLVLTAAASVYTVRLRIGFLVVALNTAVVASAAVQHSGAVADVLLSTGFYLLIQTATLLGSVALVREQRTRRELAGAHVELQAATVLLAESARTAERLRISRDLHDLIGHQLTVLTLELEAARHSEGTRARGHADKAHAVARGLLADVRETVGELRAEPSDLAEALRNVVRDLPGLQVSIDVDPRVRVNEEQLAALVRAVQEIATNTIRHAHSRELRIEVSSEASGAVLTAVDSGRGARRPIPGNGLRGLTERFEALGGGVTFDAGEGFRVTARVPVP